MLWTLKTLQDYLFIKNFLFMMQLSLERWCLKDLFSKCIYIKCTCVVFSNTHNFLISIFVILNFMFFALSSIYLFMKCTLNKLLSIFYFVSFFHVSNIIQLMALNLIQSNLVSAKSVTVNISL